jgi:hypothetical protein
MESGAHPLYTTKAHYGWSLLLGTALPVVWFGWPLARSIATFEFFFPGTIVSLLLVGALAVSNYFFFGSLARRFEVWSDRLVVRQGRGRSKDILFGSIKSVKKEHPLPLPLGILTLGSHFVRFATSMGMQVVVYYDDYQSIRPTPHDPKRLFNELEVALSEYRGKRTIRV